MASTLNSLLDVLMTISIQMQITPSRSRIHVPYELFQLDVGNLVGCIRAVRAPIAVEHEIFAGLCLDSARVRRREAEEWSDAWVAAAA